MYFSAKKITNLDFQNKLYILERYAELGYLPNIEQLADENRFVIGLIEQVKKFGLYTPRSHSGDFRSLGNAIQHGTFEDVREYVEAGWQPVVYSMFGSTLEDAIKLNRLDVAEYLIQNGARKSTHGPINSNRGSMDPTDFKDAKEKYKKRISEFNNKITQGEFDNEITSIIKTGMSPCLICFILGLPDPVSALDIKFPKINEFDSKIKADLFEKSCYWGFYGIVKKFLDLGFEDIKKEDIISSANNGHYKVIKTLIDSGYDLKNLETVFYHSPHGLYARKTRKYISNCFGEKIKKGELKLGSSLKTKTTKKELKPISSFINYIYNFGNSEYEIAGIKAPINEVLKVAQEEFQCSNIIHDIRKKPVVLVENNFSFLFQRTDSDWTIFPYLLGSRPSSTPLITDIVEIINKKLQAEVFILSESDDISVTILEYFQNDTTQILYEMEDGEETRTSGTKKLEKKLKNNFKILENSELSVHERLDDVFNTLNIKIPKMKTDDDGIKISLALSGLKRTDIKEAAFFEFGFE